MNKRSFWKYAATGLVIGTCAALFWALIIGPSFIFNNPTHDEYAKLKSEHQLNLKKWEEKKAEYEKDHEGLILQHQVEEVIAGMQPCSVLRGSPLEGIACKLHQFNTGVPTDARQRAEAIVHLMVDTEHNQYLSYYLECSGTSNCKFKNPLGVLNDANRFTELLSGNKNAVLPAIAPAEDFTKNKPQSAVEGKPEPMKTLAVPHWFGASIYLVYAVGFALGFFLMGLSKWHSGKEKKPSNPWSHPCTTLPDFPLAWMLMFTTLPGLFAGYLIYTLTLSINLLSIKRLFIKETFDQEVATLRTMLHQLEKNQRFSNEYLKKLGDWLKNINSRQDNLDLATLRDILTKATLVDDDTLYILIP